MYDSDFEVILEHHLIEVNVRHHTFGSARVAAMLCSNQQLNEKSLKQSKTITYSIQLFGIKDKDAKFERFANYLEKRSNFRLDCV